MKIRKEFKTHSGELKLYVPVEEYELLVAEIEKLRLYSEKMRAVLRAVRADRPSAHSDVVWQMINEVLDETDVDR